MNGIYLLLGTNLGDRLNNLRTASKLLQDREIRILNESSIYETEPWGKSDQGWFLNIVLQIETNLSPNELLNCCLEIEQRMGRIRQEKWSERLIDVDILYYESQKIETDILTVPHKAIQDRKFTLIPMNELAPEAIHPVLNDTQANLLANCTDELDCNLTEFQL